MSYQEIIKDVMEEVSFAEKKYTPYRSSHEGYAIIKEEVDELWDEVKMKNQSYARQYTEAKHIACTAIRFMIYAAYMKLKEA